MAALASSCTPLSTDAELRDSLEPPNYKEYEEVANIPVNGTYEENPFTGALRLKSGIIRFYSLNNINQRDGNKKEWSIATYSIICDISTPEREEHVVEVLNKPTLEVFIQRPGNSHWSRVKLNESEPLPLLPIWREPSCPYR